LCSGCASLVSRAAPSQSSTAGARGTCRALHGNRGRVGPAQRRRHSRRGNRGGGRGKACDIGDPDRVPVGGDPIGSGLVASLARPGGNVTGLSNLGSDLAAKRLGLLREVLPGFRRLAVMANAAYSGNVRERLEIDAAARTLGLEIIAFPIRRVEEIAPSTF